MTDEILAKVSENFINDNITDISLAHYFYLPTEDYQTVKTVWDKLSHKYDLSGFNLDESSATAQEEKPLSSGFPILLKNDRVAIGFIIAKNITAIELLYLSGLSVEIAEELEETRQLFQDQVDYLIGESTVAVADDQNKDELIGAIGQPFSNARICTAEMDGASVAFIHSNERLRHYCIAYRKDPGKIINLLLSKLPVLDALTFKLTRQSDYFKDQRNFARDKKGASDRSLSGILHQWAELKSSSERNIEILEADVDRLSTIYGELASNLKLIKNSHDVIDKNLGRLDSLLKELIINPEDITSFKDSYLGEYINLLKDLKSDDILLHRSLDDTRATIEVVRTRIELERSRESVLLQKEGVSVQIAAGFIELFIVGFYTLEAWELLASKEVFEHMPVSLRLGIDAMFAVTVVGFTHYMAKFIQKEKSNLGLIISGLGIIIFLALMVLTTTNYATNG